MTFPRTGSFETHGAGAGEAQASPAIVADVGGIQPLIVELKVCHHWGWASDFIPAIFIPVKNHAPIVADQRKATQAC